MPGYFLDSRGNVFKPESIISESPSYTVNVPQRPVPLGDVTHDHGQKMPMTLSVVMDVTENPWEGREMFYQVSLPPLQLDPDETNDNGELVVDLGADLGETTIRSGLSADAPADVLALRWLEAVRGERIGYYSTKLDPLYVCMVTSISTMRTNSGKLRITVQLEETLVAEAQTVRLPPRAVKAKKADPKETKGDQPASSEGKPKEAETAALFGLKVLGVDVSGFSGPAPPPELPSTSSPEELADALGVSVQDRKKSRDSFEKGVKDLAGAIKKIEGQ